jgi:hypothetical protein
MDSSRSINSGGSTLIRIFDHFPDAEQARTRLLAEGFPPHAVQLDAGDDEAGPVQGNFTVGNRDTMTSRLERAINALFGGDNHMYRRNYGKTAFRGMVRLVVATRHADEQERAHAILQACGGSDIEQRTARCGHDRHGGVAALSR